MPKLGLGLSLVNPRIIGGGGPFIPSDIPGLFAYYNFDETPVFAIAYDSSGNGNNLYLQEGDDSAEKAVGVIDLAISFHGSGDEENPMTNGMRYANGDFPFNPNSNFSISVWMKTRNFNEYSHVIGAPFQNGLFIGGNDTNQTFNLFNGSVFGVTAPTVTSDTWHHYVFIRDGTFLTLYADNVYVDSNDIGGETFSGDPVLSVGGGEYNQYYYDGDIDALGFWNTAMTESDVAKLWNGGSGVQMPT